MLPEQVEHMQIRCSPVLMASQQDKRLVSRQSEGNKVKLYYAKVEDLRDYLNLTEVRGEGGSTVLAQAGDEMVELSFSGDTGKTATPCLPYVLF